MAILDRVVVNILFTPSWFFLDLQMSYPNGGALFEIC